ncbi:MAG: HD domain-containing protein [Oscillospiraceae bacterium]|nr:HD domain-containing protein [Oscillospiraceae bacterium]
MEKPVQISRSALSALKKSGYSAFLVGGSVRDRLMGRPVHDIDIATNALPQETARVFEKHAVIPTGLAHGTVTVLIENTPVEITTFRTESAYSDNRHPDFVSFSKNISDDLSRRDFTMNAIAEDENGALFDPFGGKEDIEKKLIRCVGNAETRFKEDALRILRALRFSAVLSFSIEEETERAIRKCRTLLHNLSPERIASELSLLLCSDGAVDVLLRYPEFFAEIIPCLKAMQGFDQHNEHHCFDVWEHTVNVVRNVRPALHLRLAALFHDCAKPLVFSLDENGTGHFYSHAPKGAAIAEKELKRLRFDNETTQKVVKLVKIHDSPIECSEVTVKKKLNRLGEEMFFDLIRLQRADNLAQSEKFRFRQKNFDYLEETAKKILEKSECFSLKKLDVNGYDMLSLGLCGKEIGAMLNFLVEQVIEGKTANEKPLLLAAAKREKEKRKKP